MTSPHVDLGNSYQDTGKGINTFIQGMLEQRQRQQQLALQEGLLAARKAELTKPNYTMRPAINPTTNRLEYAGMDESGRQPPYFTGLNAPESQMDVPLQDANGQPIVGSRPRYVPGQPVSQVDLPSGTQPRVPQVVLPTATNGTPSYTSVNPRNPNQPGTEVQMPPGTIARPAPSVPMTTDSPNGPVIRNIPRTYGGGGTVTDAGGQPVQPRGDEGDERRARDAFEMIQAKKETDRALVADPGAYQEAARHIASLDIADKVPVVGPILQSFIRNGQSTLSPNGAAYFSAFMQLAAARAFSRGGATLTKNEIEYALAALSPKLGESGDVSAMRDRLFNGVLYGSIRGNPAWLRYQEAAKGLGFNINDAQSDIIPPQPPKPNRYHYTR